MLRCRNCTATLAFESAVRKSFGPKAALQQTKNCTATSRKLRCRKIGAFLPLSCGFQAPTFRHPRLGPAECFGVCICHVFALRNLLRPLAFRGERPSAFSRLTSELLCLQSCLGAFSGPASTQNLVGKFDGGICGGTCF